MSYFENKKPEEIEKHKLKGASDMGIDLTKCNNILTEDLKFTLYHDDHNLLLVNNSEKSLISKKIFTKKIQKLKVHQKNFISYLLDDEEGSTIITTHLDCIEDNLEMKRPFKIIDYLIFNFLAPLEFYLYLNYNGDIHTCRNAEIISKSTNIFRDVSAIDRNFAFRIEDVTKIFYSEETQNLILFFTQGKMLNYFIDTASFNPNNNLNINLIINNNINTNNLNKQNILIFQDFLNLITENNSNQLLQDNNRSSSSSLINLGFPRSSAQSACEIIKVQTIAQRTGQANKTEFYLVVGYNHSKTLDKVSVFFFIKNDLISSGNFNLEAQKNIRHVSRLVFLHNKIDYANAFNIQALNRAKINDLSLFGLELFNTEFSLNKKISAKSPNSILFVMKSESEGCFFFFICSLKNYLSENNDKKPIKYFSKFSVDGNFYSILNLNQMGIFYDDYDSAEEEQSADFFSKIMISIRATYAKNKNQIYVLDDVLVYEDFFNEDKKQIIASLDIKRIFAQDPFDFFDFYQTQLNSKLNEYEEKSKAEIIEQLKSKMLISHEVEFANFDKNNSNYKFDSFLANLILANDYLTIKNYLSILDTQKADFPFVSNEKLFFTIKTFYVILNKEISNKINENILNAEFFGNQKLLEALRISNKLLYVNKSRAENSIFKPYVLEKEILIENSNAISQLIEKVESLITIVKIFKCISSGRNAIKSFAGFESHKFEYFNAFVALVFPVLEKKILPKIELFYINYIQSFLALSKREQGLINAGEEEQENKPFFYSQEELNNALKNSLYASNFMLFFVFAYYAILSEVLKLTEIKNCNNNNINNALNFSLIGSDKNLSDQIKYNILKLFGEELSEEINSHFDLVYQVFLLDYNANLAAQQIYSEIQLKTNLLSDFILFLNKENYALSPFTNQLSHFNSSFLNHLLGNARFQDALAISKPIIPFYKQFEELLCQLKIFLNSDLLLMGFQFVNDCFAFLIKLPNAKYSHISRSEAAKKKFFEELKQENNFLILAMLYQEFFSFLINNNKIEFLFNLPLNIVERNILKDLILSEGKLEHLIILYYMKIKNLSAAEISFNEIKNSGNFNEENFNVYSKFIKAMKFIFAKKDANSLDDWANEAVDSEFFSGSASKDYKIGINFRNNHIQFKGVKPFANRQSDFKNQQQAEDKMDIVDNASEEPEFRMNQNARFNNFDKINEPIGMK